MNASTAETLTRITKQLLDAIDTGDWKTYQQMCDPTLSAFEPEATGHMVEGMEFHETYFANPANSAARKSSIRSPHLRLLGDTAVVSYVRLMQSISADGQHSTSSFEETRVWQQIEGDWKHVHFHRSKMGQWN